MEKNLINNQSNQTETNILGYEKIGKLMRIYAVPSIISILVNALYNIVDQIFIGWGVGYLGNGATNIIFPITIVFASFALMFGDGSSAYLSLKLGENKKEEASKGVASGIISAMGISAIFTVGVLLFLPQLLQVFGCTPILESYAKDYGYIIALGLPFMVIGTTVNSIIRADGNPKYAMITMVIGAALNVVLDPIFIFVFHWGVKGAAIATVISQIVSFLLNTMYLRKLKTIRLKNHFKFSFRLARKVSTLGLSSFITQMSAALIMGLQNNLLTKYGLQSIYGPEIPLTVLGIVMKVNEILNSIVLGLAMGAQPILGFNYGAGNYERVKKTLKTVVVSSLIVSSIAFVLFQAIPDKIIILFGSSNDLKYIEFAKLAFRVYLLMIIGNGIQTSAGIFLQAIGRSAKSALLSMSKQVLFLVPGMLLLGRLFGIDGVLFAKPVADGFALLLAVILLAAELKRLGRTRVPSAPLDGDTSISTSISNTLDRQILITISREYGSGGRYIGKMIADQLGIRFYDKDIIVKLSEKTGLAEEYIENIEEKRTILSGFNKGYYTEPNSGDELFIKESQIIREIAEKESCVIIGRCADYILKDKENLIRIFIYSSMEDKVKRAVTYYGLDRDNAEKVIRKCNKERAIHYKHYTDRDWADKSNYDICVNSDLLGVEKTAELICVMIKEKLNLIEK